MGTVSGWAPPGAMAREMSAAGIRSGALHALLNRFTEATMIQIAAVG
jgi:hypothetical protein